MNIKYIFLLKSPGVFLSFFPILIILLLVQVVASAVNPKLFAVRPDTILCPLPKVNTFLAIPVENKKNIYIYILYLCILMEGECLFCFEAVIIVDI